MLVLVQAEVRRFFEAWEGSETGSLCLLTGGLCWVGCSRSEHFPFPFPWGPIGREMGNRENKGAPDEWPVKANLKTPLNAPAKAETVPKKGFTIIEAPKHASISLL